MSKSKYLGKHNDKQEVAIEKPIEVAIEKPQPVQQPEDPELPNYDDIINTIDYVTAEPRYDQFGNQYQGTIGVLVNTLKELNISLDELLLKHEGTRIVLYGRLQDMDREPIYLQIGNVIFYRYVGMTEIGCPQWYIGVPSAKWIKQYFGNFEMFEFTKALFTI